MKTPKWDVVEATPQEDYKILLLFADGSKRLYDARPLLEKPISSALNNKGLFMQGHAAYGTVVWTDEIDIAPEDLYENSILLDS